MTARIAAPAETVGSRRRRLGARRFSMADQERFAALSGDFNPLHVDPLAARRGLFGELVVHGLHVAIWALEVYLAGRRGDAGRVSLRGVSARFAKPVFLGESVRADLLEETRESARLQIVTDGMAVAEVSMRGVRRSSADEWPDRMGGARSMVPKAWTAQDLPGLSGTMELRYEGRTLRREFPACCDVLGTGVVARLLGLSRLVGMECPGLHSLLSSLEVELVPAAPSPTVAFAVERFDARFSAVRTRISGAGLRGTLDAFLRPSPAAPVSMEAVARVVLPGEFSGQRALVVGGSRGLGEAVAKVVAGGGGHVVVTYKSGEGEAQEVVRDIRRWGGGADLIQLDVAHPRAAVLGLARAGWRPTHLYYLATPRIFVRRSRLFDERVLRRFLSVYVEGLGRTYDACRRVSPGLLRVFYPSSEAVTEPLKELTEYATAKAAGEALCGHLSRFGPETRVLVERLPRIRTDQTATLVEVPAADALTTMAGVARRLAAL